MQADLYDHYEEAPPTTRPLKQKLSGGGVVDVLQVRFLGAGGYSNVYAMTRIEGDPDTLYAVKVWCALLPELVTCPYGR